ncbi:hypothetical protein D3C76_102680 [compost metagenome]
MGLFDLSLTKTPKAQLNCALNNLSYFQGLLEHFEDPRDKYGNAMPDYLLDFAVGQIKEALELLESSVDRA